MPKRGTQQNLRNFEAVPLGLETSAMVNAELLFGSMKIGRTAGYLASDVNEALLIAGPAEVWIARRSGHAPLFH